MKYAFYSNLINQQNKVIHFIGGGGKSTLMHRIACEGIKNNKKIIITSLYPFLTPLDSSIVLIKDLVSSKQHVSKELQKYGLLYLGKGYEKAYISGFSKQDIEKIINTIAFDHIFIESDCVAGRSLSDFQAVKHISNYKIDRIFNVIGSDAFNQAKTDSWLKTKDIFWNDKPVLAPLHIAAWLKNHQRITKITKQAIPITYFINKVENIYIENLTIPLAKNLKLSGIDRVFIGSVYNSYLFEVKE
jgi:hypothetical protein